MRGSTRGLASDMSRGSVIPHWLKRKSQNVMNLAPGGPGRVLEIMGRMGLQLFSAWLSCPGILSSKSADHGQNAGKAQGMSPIS